MKKTIYLLKNIKHVILDADALTSFKKNTIILKKLLDENKIITPHIKEFKAVFPELKKINNQRKLILSAVKKTKAVIVLKGNGKHFSAGHDIGTPGRDVDVEYDRKSMWYDHTNKPGGEFWYVREQEVYLNMCRRWRDMPKPTIAMVHGACVAGQGQFCCDAVLVLVRVCV